MTASKFGYRKVELNSNYRILLWNLSTAIFDKGEYYV